MLERLSSEVLTRCAVALGMGLLPLALLSTGNSDVTTQTTWLSAALERGPVAGYVAVLDYPPGTTLVMWAVTSLLGLPLEHAVKLVSAGALVLGTFTIGRMVSGRAAVATVLVFAYPTVILGYTDSLSLTPLAVAVFSRHWATRLFAVVLLVSLKWTALILCPVFLAIWVADVRNKKRVGARRLLGDVLPAIGVVLAFLFTYGPRTLVNHLAVASSTTTSPSANAFNVHWLISWFWFDGAPYGSEVYDSISSLYRALFQILVAFLIVAVAVLAFRSARSDHHRLACLRTAVVAYFLFAAFSVHENHLFLAVALSIMVWGRGWERWTTTAILGAAYLSNLFLYYGPSGTQRPLYSLGNLALAVGLAVVACLIWVGGRDLLLAFRQPRLTVEMRDAQR